VHAGCSRTSFRRQDGKDREIEGERERERGREREGKREIVDVVEEIEVG